MMIHGTQVQVVLSLHRREDLHLSFVEAAACGRLGARNFLGGPTDQDGRLTLSKMAVATWLKRLSAVVPEASITLDTRTADCGKHLHSLACDRSTRPHFAAVDFGSNDAERVATHMINHGVGIEACISDRVSVGRFLCHPLRKFCRRVVLQIPDMPGEQADGHLTELFYELAEVIGTHDLLLEGLGRTMMTMAHLAVRGGLMARVGRPLLRGSCWNDHATAEELLRSLAETTMPFGEPAWMTHRSTSIAGGFGTCDH
ncbi:hypothetical protein [Tabrizicola sp. TH137]|uniref:hypothetical protein n=1 Tax=Tabrizicola sp. TH137 TaxID=2067452 RepID=UPI001180F803|nr:hypothetical protein [Tabrizicola sp. TH137]